MYIASPLWIEDHRSLSKSKALYYWSFVRGIHRWPLDFPHKGPLIENAISPWVHFTYMPWAQSKWTVQGSGPTGRRVETRTPVFGETSPSQSHAVWRGHGALLWWGTGDQRSSDCLQKAGETSVRTSDHWSRLVFRSHGSVAYPAKKVAYLVLKVGARRVWKVAALIAKVACRVKTSDAPAWSYSEQWPISGGHRPKGGRWRRTPFAWELAPGWKVSGPGCCHWGRVCCRPARDAGCRITRDEIRSVVWWGPVIWHPTPGASGSPGHWKGQGAMVKPCRAEFI